eukprot:587548-Pleurochrysis_carterae.AAC.1
MLLESSESAKSTKLQIDGRLAKALAAAHAAPTANLCAFRKWSACVGVAVRRRSFGGDAPHIVSFAQRLGDDARVTVQDRLRVCNA